MYFSVSSVRLMSQGFMLFEWIRSSRISFHVGCWTNSVMFSVIFSSSMFFNCFLCWLRVLIFFIEEGCRLWEGRKC